MNNRQAYLEGQISHEDYYTGMAEDLDAAMKHVRLFSRNGRLVQLMEETLKSGKPYTDTGDQKLWDNLATEFGSWPVFRVLFKHHGDFVTHAGMVCLLKQIVLLTATDTWKNGAKKL